MAKKIFNFGERLALYEDLPINVSELTNDAGYTTSLDVQNLIDASTIQYSTMPTAGADNLGKIIQYTGATDSTYTNGYFYVCVSDGQDPATYSWINTNVQSSTGDVHLLTVDDGFTSSNPFVFADHKPGIYCNMNTSSNPNYHRNFFAKTKSNCTYNLISGQVIFIAIDKNISEMTSDGYFATLFIVQDGVLKMLALTTSNDLSTWSAMQSEIYGSFLTEYSQSVYGTKTFNSFPITPSSAPTTDYQTANKKYVDDQDKIILNNIAPQYSTSSTYNEGDHVIYNGVLYECNTTISAAEAWTPAHWTQKEILSYIDNKISNIDTTKREIVQTLPTQDIATDTIYMVPKTTPGTQNVYDEYMYINNAWELIGSTEIDLTNYYTKAEVNAMIQNINDQIGNISEVLSHLTDPVIPVGTVLYTDDITADNGEGTYTVTTKEFHADSNYYVIDYTFTNTGSTAISGIVLDEYTTSTDSHLPLMADYQIEPGETITLTSYWQDSVTYAATETAYQIPNNVTVSFDTTDNTTNYSVNVPLSGLGFSTDVVAHPNVYNSSDMGEGFVMTTFDRTGGTEDPYTVPEEFYVAWINQTNQTYATISAPISDTLTMTRSYLGFSTSQFDATNTKFFLIKTADIVDGTYQEFLDAYNAFINGGV